MNETKIKYWKRLHRTLKYIKEHEQLLGGALIFCLEMIQLQHQLTNLMYVSNYQFYGDKRRESFFKSICLYNYNMIHTLLNVLRNISCWEW